MNQNVAIDAFGAAPEAVRRALRDVVATLDTAVCEKQGRLRNADDIAGISEDIARQSVEEIRPLISAASAIIHGESTAIDTDDAGSQAEIDALFA